MDTLTSLTLDFLTQAQMEREQADAIRRTQAESMRHESSYGDPTWNGGGSYGGVWGDSGTFSVPPEIPEFKVCKGSEYR